MREMEFKMERQGLLKEGQRVRITEGVLPSNYYYTIDPSLAMSGNFPFKQRLLAREGLVTAIRELERGFYGTVRFDEDRDVTYETGDLEDLEPAYCLSVHKSQGSEFPVIVMPVTPGPPMLLTRNLLYTALTRAKSLVVLVGMESVIRRMVENDHVIRRYTTLARRLIDTGELVR